MRHLQRFRRFIPNRCKEPLRKIRARLLSIGLSSADRFVQPDAEITASAFISIVIPIRDTPGLQRCLASIARFAPRAQVILVDDGSVDEDVKTLMQSFVARHDWTLLRNSIAQGHSRASEAGARFATRPYLCLLNADTVITPWSWKAAVNAFETDSTIAVTGPSTSHTTTPQLIERAELCRHYWTDAQIFAFADKHISALAQHSPVDLPEVGGFAFFIRRHLWEQLGGFDPNLPDYGNEVELCRRLSILGWRIVWTPGSYIHHFGSKTYSTTFGDAFVSARCDAAQEYINKKHSRARHGN